MLKQAIEQIRTRSLEASLAALGTILLSGLLLAENHLAGYVSTIDPTIIVRIVAALFAITAYSWAAYFYFKPRIEFDKHRQIYTDVKTDIPYCPSCKDGHNRLAKLIKHESCWQCSIKECRMIYDDPDYIPQQKDKATRTSAYG